MQFIETRIFFVPERGSTRGVVWVQQGDKLSHLGRKERVVAEKFAADRALTFEITDGAIFSRPVDYLPGDRTFAPCFEDGARATRMRERGLRPEFVGRAGMAPAPRR